MHGSGVTVGRAVAMRLHHNGKHVHDYVYGT